MDGGECRRLDDYDGELSGVCADRRQPPALSWTTQFASGRHGMGMPAAVAAEIVDAFQGQGNVIKKRDDVHKMAAANKAFAHYAW